MPPARPSPLTDTDIPGTTWVVLAAHGSTRRPEANDAVSAHAARLRGEDVFRNASAAFLIGDAGPADAVDGIDAETVVIVPFMMSDGYLAGEISNRIESALAARGGTSRIAVTDPVGTHPDIARIAERLAVTALTGAGLDTKDATLVLVAHGSSGRPESKACAEAHANTLRNERIFSDVRLAMLEEEPFLDGVLAEIDGPAAVVGLFAAPGGHAVDDVRQAIANRASADIVDAGPVGTDPAMTAIARMRALAALKR
ncbi:MAG: hypothetical protein JJ855_15755 [Rhodospirillales bacterium]|nr:hypothetical protein [Rhodospirillales bacterium]